MAIELKTNFNVAPYYDDYDKAKNFYRILFKPGKAVQARELTQLQTILQNQIESIGTNIFKTGSIVVGGRSFYTNGIFLKLFSSGDVSTFENKTIVGSTSGATGFVKKAIKGFTRNSVSYPSALYLNSFSGDFIPGETISIQDTTTTVVLDSSSTYSGPCNFFNIDETVFYVNGFFVYCDPQFVVVSDTFVATPSARIGLKVVESIVESADDSSLLDPALGSNNYFAPGADRYSIELILSSIEYDSGVENSDAITIDNFFDFANIRNGQVIKIKIDSDYNKLEDALAKRTYDESGNFTIKPFLGKVRSHVYGNNSKFTFELSPGRAYVLGYGFETTSPSYVTIDKARDYSSVNNFPIAADYASYITVSDLSGSVNPSASQEVELHNNSKAVVNLTDGTTYGNTKIGTARIRYLDYVSGSPDKYNLHLFDINLNSGNTVSDIKSFYTSNKVATPYTAIFSANVFANTTTLVTGIDDSLLFRVPQYYIKTFNPGGVSDTTITSAKFFEGVNFISGTGADTGNSIAQITLTGTEYFIGTGNLSDDAIKERFYVAVKSTSTSSPNVNETLTLTSTSGDVVIDATGQVATLKWVGNGIFSANVVALTQTTGALPKTKTYKTGNVTLAYPTYTSANVIDLYPDVVNIISIDNQDGNSYISSYVLDNGQRDDYYNVSNLTIKPGFTAPSLNVANDSVTVTFTYFEHSGTSPFFSADSYTNIAFENIPDYTTSKGITYSLSDVLDFRPVKQVGSNSIVNSSIITPLSTITADYEYYLGRADRVVITKDKEISVIKGLSSIAPELPPENPEAMTLYTLRIPPYTKSIKQVSVGYVDNKKYTNKDIGLFDKRINRLEYFTALSLLEKLAADQKIPSSVPSVERFKNGILVDPFSGHGIADVSNGDYVCSIDQENRILRPAIATEVVNYNLNIANSANVVKKGPLILPSYTETPFLSQLKATRFFNITPYEVFDWIGEITLSPSTDIWVDTYRNPSVTVNLNGENDAFSIITPDDNGLTPWATRWNAWQSIFRGVTDVKVSVSTSTSLQTVTKVDAAGNQSATSVPVSTSTATTDVSYSEAFGRTGLEYSRSSKTITTQLGERLVDSSIIPYIRSKIITFVAKNMKPNTRLQATFDNVTVTKYCDGLPYIELSSNIAPTTTITSIIQGSTSSEVVLQQRKRLYYQPNISQNVHVTGSVTLATSNSITLSNEITSVVYPETLKTDETGSIAGVFYLPNTLDIRFNVGERPFTLTDNLDKVLSSTIATTKYLAQGLSTTSQDTTLATRVNTVSIQPKSQYKTVAGNKTVNVVEQPPDTTRPISPDNPVINDNNVDVSSDIQRTTNAISLECNSLIDQRSLLYPWDNPDFNNPYSFTGTAYFNLNISANTSGKAQIQVITGRTPVKAKLYYLGQVLETPFVMNTTSVASETIASYNAKLQKLGYSELTHSTGTYIQYVKQKTTEFNETAILEIISPISGPGAWQMQCGCPGVDPAVLFSQLGPLPLSLEVRAPQINFLSLTQGFNAEVDDCNGIRTTTALTDIGIPLTIRNATGGTASNFGFHRDSNYNGGRIRITAIGVAISNDGISRGIDYSFETTGESKPLGDNTKNIVIDANDENSSRNSITGGAISYKNTLGALPIILNPGEQKSLTLRIKKSVEGYGEGAIVINVVAEPADPPASTGQWAGITQPLVVDSISIPINTSKTSPNHKVTLRDPVAQTFFVDAIENPSGLFLTSVDVWFATKSNNLPVTLQIRPVVNGFPSSDEIIPFSNITKDADKIISSSTEGVFNESENTTFTFNSPVYLPPGQYAIVILTNSNDYNIYSAFLGEFLIGSTTERVTKQPLSGSLFKSQNGSTWTPEQEEDIAIRINRAKFTPLQTSTAVLNNQPSIEDIKYDVLYTFGESLDFPNTSRTYAYKRTENSTEITESNFVNFQLGKNEPMLTRKVIKAGSSDDLQLRVNLRPISDRVAPLIDLERLGSYAIRNLINDVSTNETNNGGGDALARYLTKRVTLAPGFEAQDLKVYVLAYCPGTSSFKVYYKVNAPGSSNFDLDNNYVEMTQTAVSGNQREEFAEFTFENPNETVFEDGTKFNLFTIKIVMLSSNPAQVPMFKDLRVLALDDY